MTESRASSGDEADSSSPPRLRSPVSVGGSPPSYRPARGLPSPSAFRGGAASCSGDAQAMPKSGSPSPSRRVFGGNTPPQSPPARHKPPVSVRASASHDGGGADGWGGSPREAWPDTTSSPRAVAGGGGSGGGGQSQVGVPRVPSRELVASSKGDLRNFKAAQLALSGDAIVTTSRPINVHVKGAGGKRVCLRCVLDAAPPPPDLETMHGLESVLAQASILVTCTDITVEEDNQELVRRRYLISYNEKWSDPEVAKLFSRRMTYNKAGTQAPLSAASAAESATGVSTYLDRRRLFVQA